MLTVEIELSLSPVTVAELVHGIYRARTPEDRPDAAASTSKNWSTWCRSIPSPTDGVPGGSDRGPGSGERKRAAVQRSPHRRAAIEQGYAVLTENLRHFQKIPNLTVIPF